MTKKRNEELNVRLIDRIASVASVAKTYADCGDLVSAKERLQKVEELIGSVLEPKLQPAILVYLYQQIKAIEVKTGCVVVIQFATHPSGNLAIVFRAHQPSTGKEYPISDVIMMSEIEDNANVIPRLEVLFENIHKALNSIQVIGANKGQKVIH